MKKIYSIVLMATALLIGTNVKAVEVSSWDDLKSALEAGGTVTLGDDIIFNYDASTFKSILIGAKNSAGTALAVDGTAPAAAVLDLAGHNITITANGYANINPFVLTKGSLKVTGTGTIELTGDLNKSTNVFFVFGADAANKVDPKTNPFSKLEIDQDVTVKTNNGTVIAIDQLTTSHAALTKTDFAGKGYETSTMAYGVFVDVKGSLTSELPHAGANEKKCYGIKVNGNVNKPASESDYMYTPYVHVESTAVIKSDMSAGLAGSTAIYASGYGQWLIEGNCSGASGVYVSSGSVTINNAIVKSGAAYDAATGGTHANGSGNAITINSRSTRPGDISVTISGTSEVTSTNGYAVEESVTSATSTKVDALTITGGTFQGNSEVGTISISESAQNSETTTVQVKGGVFAGNIETLIEAADNKNQIIEQVVSQDEHGNAVVVIGQQDPADNVDAPETEAEKTAFEFAASNDIVKLDASTASISKTLPDGVTEVKYLSLTGTGSNTSTVTVEQGKTLKVGQIVMNANGRIVVEAGATLIVTGSNGIFADNVENIVLANTATFLFNPEVQSNRHPSATVKILAKQIGYEDFDGKRYWYWHRFALPIQQATNWTKSPNVTSYLYGWSYADNDWKSYSALTDMKPFVGSLVTANQATLADVEYTFTGVLAGGNDNNSLQFQREGYHFFGNSYTGHISIDKLVEQIMGDSEIDGTVWVWSDDYQNYYAVPLMALRNNPATFQDFQKEIAPMETFVLKHNVTTTGSTELNYASAVWGNPRYASLTGAAAGAPRRAIADENTHVRVVVTAENGKSDEVMLFEDALCSDDYDNGYDGTKYMNENALNMYATVNGNNYSFVATDNIEGKKLTINTVNEVNYTMSFVNVNGEEYAIRDNATGAVIAIEEGATYQFAAQPNSVVEDRFEVVGIQKITTAIENTEAKASAKGIYTIMGQYVGEDFDILPAGIYVVNGVKIVK